MKVLITGGGGFIGYRLARRLLERGTLTGPDGKSTNAIYGFVNMLRKLIADHHPEYIVASFDLPGRTFRDDLAADYKANRTPMPSDLAEQVATVHAACEAMGVPNLMVENYEADDVLGTLAVKACAAGFEVAIVTGDKDSRVALCRFCHVVAAVPTTQASGGASRARCA